MHPAQAHLNGRFIYVADRRWKWRILRGDGPVAGDCEDYALTLVWLRAGRSMARFWLSLLALRHVIWLARFNGTPHAVLWTRGEGWTDNIMRQPVDRLPDRYRLRYPLPAPIVALLMGVSR